MAFSPCPTKTDLKPGCCRLQASAAARPRAGFIAPLKKVPLTEGGDSEAIPFWQYEQAAAGDGGGAFAAALQRSSPQFVWDLVENARSCLKAVAQLETVLEARCGAETPSFSRLREVLGGIVDAIKGHAGAMLASRNRCRVGSRT